jgi:mono/diheme cytochrome c family protein
MLALRLLTAVTLGIGVAALVAGCGKSDPTSSAQPPGAGPGSGETGGADGQSVFNSHCAKCHRVDSSAGGPKKRGPNLSKIGGEHDQNWIAEHIKNPTAHEPNSKMPSFESKLTAEQIDGVAAFLAGLK